MKFYTAAVATAMALAAGPALSQDTPELSTQATLVGNMGKIEANIAEAQARLFTHMLLPEDDTDREGYAESAMEDMASVDAYLAEVRAVDLPEEAQTQIDGFEAEWTTVKDMASGLSDASRDNLASVDDIKAYAEAVSGLDNYIDAALVAAGLPDDDD